MYGDDFRQKTTVSIELLGLEIVILLKVKTLQ